MSGHSKWASIKHKKAALDAKRGKLFSKLVKEISIAAREGGGNPDFNPTLRTAIDRAKDANMPSDTIDKAIKKGTGELPGVTYERITYEGYGPEGVAILVDVLTDNKNRSSAEIKNVFSKRNGNMAGAGSVGWQFQTKGYILVDAKVVEEEKLFDIVLEAGAEDLKKEGGNFEIVTPPQDLENVKKALASNNIKTESAELTKIPNNTIAINDEKVANQILTLIEALEDHDDVQNVYANFDIPEDILEKLSS